MSAPEPRAPRTPVGAVVTALRARPWLWPVAATQALRLARPGWWKQWPPLPLPDTDLWRFRMETAYGGEGDGEPTAEDVRSFLHWCRYMRRWQHR